MTRKQARTLRVGQPVFVVRGDVVRRVYVKQPLAANDHVVQFKVTSEPDGWWEDREPYHQCHVTEADAREDLIKRLKTRINHRLEEISEHRRNIERLEDDVARLEKLLPRPKKFAEGRR